MADVERTTNGQDELHSCFLWGGGDLDSSPAVATRSNRAPNEAVAATGAVTPASMTPLLSSIDPINAALEAAVAHSPLPTGTVRVCHATEDEWNAFADSEDPIARRNYLEWFPDTEEIHIIEFADAPHEIYIAELNEFLMDHATQHPTRCFLRTFQTNEEYKSTDRVAGSPTGSAIRGGIPRIRRLSNWIAVLGATIGSGASCTSGWTRASYNLYSAFAKFGSNDTHSSYSTPGIAAHIAIAFWSSSPGAIPTAEKLQSQP
ncbi:uncharacterized protein PITG_04758 [Phytophthora infestans T30-4]|uniref:Uncharacterized protein n=1 Tax=Phytophthora infestans (strain T30-4) TaxID=403677 RepID=D0N1Z6_PHYIT|nr:uncharacterized protein PITG_04758 [Phytophthora infestans T30-4]EEY68325.1 conserved hypothetical protein [Phytophthora infestans T30-4]|eukprot:XP_002905484.1 conserved hypothetical protein [Phytophthora infestans T30-4]